MKKESKESKDDSKACCGMPKQYQAIIALQVIQTVVLIALLVQFSALSGGSAVAVKPTQAAPSAPVAAAAPSGAPSVDDDAVRGSPDAPVTIIEFSDYECPFCARFYAQTLPSLESEYINTGKVKLVYRDFPLSFHPNAQKAAEAAECAGEQGLYWEMHDKIFENQQSLSVANFKSWAAELGADSGSFDSCLDSGAMASEVQADFRDGQVAGVQGTPAFFINGKLVSGAQPFQVFKQIIDAELG